MSTRAVVFVLVCLCLHGVQSADHGPSKREVAQAVADRLRRHVPVPRFQETQTHGRSPQQTTQELRADMQSLSQEEASLAHAEVEARTALALVNDLGGVTQLDNQPITTDEQRLRVQALSQAHDAILARQRARAHEVEEAAVQHALNIARLDRQRDVVLRHVRTVADSLAQNQNEADLGESSSSSSTGGVPAVVEESSSSSSTGGVPAVVVEESSSSSSTGGVPAVVVGESSSSSSTGGVPAVVIDESSSSSSTGGSPAPPAVVASSSSSSTDAAAVGGNTTDVASSSAAVLSSSAKQKFIPGYIDHDPFAKGQTFVSDGTGDEVNWPSPITDESDDLWATPSTQPTGGYYTPEVLPPDPADLLTSTGTGGSSALYWNPVDTTTSSIVDAQASVIDWRYKQKLRGTQRSHARALSPGDDEGNVFSLLQVAEQSQTETEDEFSAKHLAQEQSNLLAELREADKTKPGWL